MNQAGSDVKPTELIGMTVIAVRQRDKPGYEGQFVELTLRGQFGHTFSVMADDEWNLSAKKVT